MTGAEVRAALAGLGMTQRAFAARFALSEVVVSRWINGARPVPPWVPGVLALLRERTITELMPRSPRRRR
jgi:transcriptional regulator with XRE-family HTH domain